MGGAVQVHLPVRTGHRILPLGGLLDWGRVGTVNFSNRGEREDWSWVLTRDPGTKLNDTSFPPTE